jgi:hypothetical protein
VDYAATLEHDLRGFFLDAILTSRADPPPANLWKKGFGLFRRGVS